MSYRMDGIDYWEQIEHSLNVAPQSYLYYMLDSVLQQQRKMSRYGQSADSFKKLEEAVAGLSPRPQGAQ
jgi:hypothetical protein